jgi:putative DNA primase/helicase
MEAYDEARAEAESAAIEGDPVAEAVLAFMAGRREWAGTPKGLHEALSNDVGEKVARTKAWPKAAQSLTPRLKRLAPVLRKMGLEFEEYEEGDKAKTRKKRLCWRDGFGPSEESVRSGRIGGGMFGPSDVYGEQPEDDG